VKEELMLGQVEEYWHGVDGLGPQQYTGGGRQQKQWRLRTTTAVEVENDNDWQGHCWQRSMYM
jgi:hypothetical protein